MKKTFTLIALLMGMNAAHAQVAFPSSFAVWTERHGQGEANPKYAIVGFKASDITIGGVTYHKLYRSYDNATFEESEYIGGIREDAGKIWYRSATAMDEKLLYNFNVAVGDTVTDAVTNEKNMIVHSITTVTMGGVDRKLINFRTFAAPTMSPYSSWLEGVGNTGLGGLLGSTIMQPTCDCAVKTVCLTQSSVEIYHNPDYPGIACGTVVETPTITKAMASVSVMPNPVTGISRLLIPADAKYTTLTVYNMAGQRVMALALNEATEVAINGNELAPGLYMYHLAGAENTTTGKFAVE